MKNCPQTDNQSVYEHGVSVKEYTFDLISLLRTGKSEKQWRLPDWIWKYKDQILENLLPEEIISEYCIYHDIGKIYCLTYDENGKRHFPNHAEISYQTWLNCGGNEQVAKLIRMDMMIHTIKSTDINEFVQNPECITLLLVGLSEIHSNAFAFGGLDSVSFKIKWKQIDKIGRKICENVFGKGK